MSNMTNTHTNINVQFVDMTPELAGRLIQANTRNRPKRPTVVDVLAGAMSRGEWATNGDAIRVSKSGVLLDGQHRLSAVIQSGATVQMMIVSGLDDEVFSTIDRGAGRKTSDVMAILNVPNYVRISSVTRLLHTWEVCGDPFNGNPRYAATTAQQLDVYERHPGLADSASWASSKRWSTKFVPSSVVCLCHYLFTKADRASADSFFLDLETGAGLPDGSPVLLLRNRLVEQASKKGRLDKRYMTALIFKAFKLHRDGASLKQLRVRTEGDGPERDVFVI